MPLYHREIGFPSIKLPEGFLPIFSTDHAKDESEKDRYGKVDIPFSVNIILDNIIEVETDLTGRVIKILYRQPQDAFRDIVLAIGSRDAWQSGFVKTAWINERYDSHHTLDRSRYQKP